ncbi:MAG TPA: acetyl-CoA C-acyltransferase [Myxococcales bacterium]|nr:acetyl-CoA C-acyltransferase [Myxococcales bacterium]
MSAWIVDGVRTPRGRGREGGELSSIPPVKLLSDLLSTLRARTGHGSVDDVVIGCAMPTAEQGTCVARMAALLAEIESGGTTVSRFCASGLDAIATAAARVEGRMESQIVAGGVESLSRVPMFSDRGPWSFDPEVAEATGFIHMAVAADLLASRASIPREALDAYAVESHRRAARARDDGAFDRSLTPTAGLAADALIRDGLTMDDLSARPGAFGELLDDDARRRIARRYPDVTVEARHHARSAPGLADGAAALLLADDAALEALGHAPRGRVIAWAHAAVEPTLMLHGNVAATELALARAGLAVSDIDLFEVNESFAAVPLHFAAELGVPLERLNVHGGAIAMGHPLGATGGVLTLTALDALERWGERRAVVSICGGAGVATALILER